MHLVSTSLQDSTSVSEDSRLLLPAYVAAFEGVCDVVTEEKTEFVKERSVIRLEQGKC